MSRKTYDEDRVAVGYCPDCGKRVAIRYCASGERKPYLHTCLSGNARGIPFTNTPLGGGAGLTRQGTRAKKEENL